MNLFSIILIIICIIILISLIYKYSPQLDLILRDKEYVLLIWYYKYEEDESCNRVYKELLKWERN